MGIFSICGKLCEFVLDDIKVWFNSGTIFLENNKEFIVGIRYVSSMGNSDPVFSMALAVLFVKKTYKHFKGEIVPKTIIVNKSGCIVTQENLPISELPITIQGS